MAVTDQVQIEVTDNVANSVVTKFQNIAKQARAAHKGITAIQSALKGINAGGITALASAMRSASVASNSLARSQTVIAKANAQAAAANEKLALAQQRTATEAQKTELAQQKVATEYQKTMQASNVAAVAASKLADAQNKVSLSAQKLTTEQQKTAEATQRLSTEQQRTITQQANAATAQQKTATEYQRTVDMSNKAALSAQKVSTEMMRTAEAYNKVSISAARLTEQQQRVIVAMNNAAIAAQKLLTEEQRTALAKEKVATQAARTADAENKAALSALRLAEAQDRARNSTAGLGESFGGLYGKIMAVVATGFGIAGLTKALDGYENMRNRLSTVATSQEQITKLMEEMYRVSIETRTKVEDTTESFVRFDTALAKMGKSQAYTIRMTTTINKALQLSGAQAQESSAALLQLSQAFNAGKLQGDEFKSLSHNMPSIMKYIADAAHTTEASVKAMSSAGKIDLALLTKAFELMQHDVDVAFARLNPTIEGSMLVWHDQWSKFIGSIEQTTGIGTKVANVIIYLADHLKQLTIVAGFTGGALLAAFGPALIKALAAATLAVLRFTAAIAANPIGLLVVGITTAGVALAVYGDEVEVAAESHVTLMDEVRSTFSIITQSVGEGASYISSAWGSMIEAMTGSNVTLYESFVAVIKYIGTSIKWAINIMFNMFKASIVSLETLLKTVWQGLNIAGVYMYNGVVSLAEKAVNVFAELLKKSAKLMSHFSSAAAKSMEDAADRMQVSFDRMQPSDYLEGAGAKLAQAWTTGLIQDTLGQWGTAIHNHAKEVADIRRKEEQKQKDAQLRGSGVNTIKPAAGKEKKTDAQKAYEQQLKAIRKPQLDYNAALAAANTLLAKGEIGQSRYNALIERAKDHYAKATDPLYSYNKETQNTLELYTKVGPEEEALKVIQQQRNAAIEAGLPWEEKYNKTITDRVAILEAAKTRHDIMNKIYDETIGKQQQLVQQQLAYNEALNKGAISQEQYEIQTRKLNVESANLKLTMGDGSFSDVMTSAAGNVVSSYNGMMSGLSDSFGTFFTNFTDGFASSVGQAIVQGDSLTESLTNVARSITQELITSLVKLGVQYLINSTLATTSMATSTATSTAAAAATTAAWTPAAAVVSIATFGAAALTGTAAMVTSIASLTATMTALSSAGGAAGGTFKEGGYTGDVGENQVAGVVHGREYVMPANRVQGNRDKLDAMRRGVNFDSLQQNSNSAGSGQTNNFYFNTTNDIDMQNAKGDTDESSLKQVLQQASNMTQQQIADSIRRGGVWADLFRSTIL